MTVDESVMLPLIDAMSSIDELLAVAKAYAIAARVDLSTVSWRATGDTKKIAAIEAGADIQVRRFEKTMQWFSQNWPDGAAWPQGVPRPSHQSKQTESAPCPAP